MPSVAGFEAWIEIDGVRLDEFQVETDEPARTVRCWVPSAAGKNFVVHFKDATMQRTAAVYISIDGAFKCSATLSPTLVHNSREGYRITPTSISLFQFAPILLTDDESATMEDEEAIRSLGVIHLSMQEGIVGEPIPFIAPKVIAVKPLYEKIKKGGGHRVQSGQDRGRSHPGRSRRE